MTVPRFATPEEADAWMEANPGFRVTRYDEEKLDPDDDNGTMPENVNELRKAVVGHRIISVENGPVTSPYGGYVEDGVIITLDNGKQVCLVDSSDCCAYTSLEKFLLHPDKVDHMIMGVGTTNGYQTWHIFADAGDVLELTVGWSSGNPFYYGYGFDITVRDL